MVITIGIAAILGFSFYLKRRTKLLNTNNQKQLDELPSYRSLFEPTDEEIRVFEREEQLKPLTKEELPPVSDEKAQIVKNFREIWRNSLSKAHTIELLRLASESESAMIFSEISEEIVKLWRDKELKGFTIKDLADLLESHLRILPQQERTSGALFWLRREIMSLRTKSEGTS